MLFLCCFKYYFCIVSKCCFCVVSNIIFVLFLNVVFVLFYRDLLNIITAFVSFCGHVTPRHLSPSYLLQPR